MLGAVQAVHCRQQQGISAETVLLGIELLLFHESCVDMVDFGLDLAIEKVRFLLVLGLLS